MIERDVDRLLIMAREQLSSAELDALPKPTQKNIAGIFRRLNIEPTNPKVIEETKLEVERIIIKMLRQDPFFGEFLNQCILEVTDALPTAGVVMMRKHVLLAVNPTFFMKSLKNIEERGAVLKHEALHIILKHIIQMRNPKFTDKFLYNVAADLEVNQYIGSPWKLPDGAILLSTFPDLNLPENEIAEVYYELLQKVSADPSQSSALEQMRAANGHGGNGHSDHRGWGNQPSSANSQESLLDGIGNATIGDLPIHEQSIEDMVQQAVKASRMLAKLQVRYWIYYRMDRHVNGVGRRMLRIFADQEDDTTKSLLTKKTASFPMDGRMLKHYQVTADILFYFAQHDQDHLPNRNWRELKHSIANSLIEKHATITIASDSLIPWSQMGIRDLHVIRNAHPEWDWPNWEDVPERVLLRFNIIRTPLEQNSVPTNVIVLLAKNT